MERVYPSVVVLLVYKSGRYPICQFFFERNLSHWALMDVVPFDFLSLLSHIFCMRRILIHRVMASYALVACRSGSNASMLINYGGAE